MNEITRKFFCKLHEQLMKNEDYKSGYEYAKQHKLWDFMSISELIDAVKIYAKLANEGNGNAAGMAFALREIIWSRLLGEKVGA